MRPVVGGSLHFGTVFLYGNIAEKEDVNVQLRLYLYKFVFVNCFDYTTVVYAVYTL